MDLALSYVSPPYAKTWPAGSPPSVEARESTRYQPDGQHAQYNSPEFSSPLSRAGLCLQHGLSFNSPVLFNNPGRSVKPAFNHLKWSPSAVLAAGEFRAALKRPQDDEGALEAVQRALEAFQVLESLSLQHGVVDFSL